MKIKDMIMSSMREHTCSRDMCGVDDNPLHRGCMEIDSDVFVEACNATPLVNGVRLAPD